MSQESGAEKRKLPGFLKVRPSLFLSFSLSLSLSRKLFKPLGPMTLRSEPRFSDPGTCHSIPRSTGIKMAMGRRLAPKWIFSCVAWTKFWWGLAGGIWKVLRVSGQTQLHRMQTQETNSGAGCQAREQWQHLVRKVWEVAVLPSQILAVWILAAKLQNSDLNFATDFWVIFSSFFFFSREKGPKIHKKIPAKFTQKFGRKNSSRISAEAFPWKTPGRFATRPEWPRSCDAGSDAMRCENVRCQITMRAWFCCFCKSVFLPFVDPSIPECLGPSFAKTPFPPWDVFLQLPPFSSTNHHLKPKDSVWGNF